MKTQKGLNVVCASGATLIEALDNATSLTVERVLTTFGIGSEPKQMQMKNTRSIVNVISASGEGLPTEKAVADVMCKTAWTGNLELTAALSNTRFSARMPVMLSKEYYIILHFTGNLASSSSSSSSSSIDFAAILKPSVRSDYDDARTTASVAQRMSANIALNANIVITFTSNNVSVFVSAVGELPYVKSLSLRRVDILAKII